MVPASVRIRRDELKVKAKPPGHKGLEIGPGFGLAPVQKSAVAAVVAPIASTAPAAPASTDAKYQEFLASLGELGAFDG